MIALASDHGGYELKEKIKEHLAARGVEFKDYGVSGSEAADYPDVVREPCGDIVAGTAEKGIFICGTGIGISVAANKYDGIRAACCSETFSARLSREHNNANVLCFGGRILAPDYAFDLVDVFIDTPFSGDARHERRIEKIHAIERDR